MVVGARLAFLVRRAAEGHLIRMAISHDVKNGRTKVKILTGAEANEVPESKRAIFVGSLEALILSMKDFVVVDRGHRHSNGVSETCLWISSHGGTSPGNEEKPRVNEELAEEHRHSAPILANTAWDLDGSDDDDLGSGAIVSSSPAQGIQLQSLRVTLEADGAPQARCRFSINRAHLSEGKMFDVLAGGIDKTLQENGDGSWYKSFTLYINDDMVTDADVVSLLQSAREEVHFTVIPDADEPDAYGPCSMLNASVAARRASRSKEGYGV